MWYCVLESGSKGNCTLVKSETACLCFDCGGPKRVIQEGFQSIGLEPSSCDALFLSHGHSDHIKNVKMFPDIPIYASFEVQSVRDERLMTPYEPIVIGDITVTPLALSHDFEGTIGYVIEQGNEKLVLVTDTGYISQTNLSYIVNADYYILESNHDPDLLMRTGRPMYVKARILSDSGHLNNQDAAKTLCACITGRTKDILLAHLSAEANTPQLAEQTLLDVLAEQNILYQNIRIHALRQFERVEGGRLPLRG